MKPLIIIEGPDGVGKTTLGRVLDRRLGGMYIHHGAYANSNGEELCRAFLHSMEPALYGIVPVVIDRCWLSEPIYGRVFRNGANRVSHQWKGMLDNTALSCNVLMVKMMAPIDVTWATVGDRPAEELAKKREHLEAIHKGYEYNFDWHWGALFLDRRMGDPEHLADLVIDALHSRMSAIDARAMK